MQRVLSFGGVLCVVLFVLVAGPFLRGEVGTKGGEWPNHGGDLGFSRYSPLDQINKDNVKSLRIAWQRPAVSPELTTQFPGLKYGNKLLSTPLMINGVLYASDGVGLVEAFDPATGKTLWVQQLPDEDEAPPRGNASRGVAYFQSGGDERIFSVRPPYLLATDPKTGKLIRRFGEGGKVDLQNYADTVDQVPYRWLSAPLVTRDVVIVGSSTQPRSSDIRAYDVRTGKLRWTFHVIPRAGEFGADTWLGDSLTGVQAGDAAVWTMMSADEELGLVYLPTSAPTNEMWGGDRPGANLFGSSIVCLRAETGERVWHFQTVHHDIWDYDNPAPPMLIDITVNGRPIKAVVVLTKQAFAFVFDRVTGQPVWPIEERPVPKSTVPGEWTAPTQPFPTKPAPFDRQGITADDLIDFTPELRTQALEIAKRYQLGPLFMPPILKGDGHNSPEGIVQMPGHVGGVEWGGGAFDPETGILYVPSRTGGWVVGLVPRKPDPSFKPGGLTETRCCSKYLGGMEGRGIVEGPSGLPLTKPPYGRITAINMNTGDNLWMVPNGDGPRNDPALKHLNLPPLGQPGHGMPLVTKTMLIVTEGDPINNFTPSGGGIDEGKKVRAFDKASGAVLWETEFEAGANGSPITYMYKGKQYLLMSIGSRTHPGEWVALSLP